MADKVKKAHGHIIQADWNQTDPLQMDYIHNKPSIPSVAPSMGPNEFGVLEFEAGLAEHNTNGEILTNEHLCGANTNKGYDTLLKLTNYGNVVATCYDVLTAVETGVNMSNQHTINYVNTVSRTKVVNRGRQLYSSQFRVGDLRTFSENDYENINEVGLWEIEVSLPERATQNTEYTFTISNTPLEDGLIDDDHALAGGWGAGIGIMPTPVDWASITDTNWEDPENAEYGKAPTKGLFYAMSVDYNNYEVRIRDAIVTGPWRVVFGESSGSFPNVSYFDDCIIDYSCYLSENDEEYLGPVHSISLVNTEEIHYDYPVTELTINDLVVNDPNYSHEWTVSFIAGDSDPLVIVPNEIAFKIKVRNESQPTENTVIYPLKWLYAEPVFEANHRYLITFKQIIDTIYGVWTVLE